jgi:ABC-type branched-subunit amino acid transport system permease subunit
MSYEPPTGEFPQAPDAVAGPQVGTDEWVAKYFEREQGYTGRLGSVRRRLERVPPGLWLLVFVASAALIPLLTSNDYVIRVGADTLIFMLLALGLNIVVGWAGMLDLGYVAFFGIGAYLYAILSSDQFDIHWPAIVTVPIVVVTVALFGLLLGLPSRRLLGDYLAIVTLFFLQIFVTLVTNANRLSLPFVGQVDYTGGPNGIPDVDAFKLFGYVFNSNTQYFYLGLGVFAILIAALWTLNESRTGRAWRALREDSLAAELMSMPVNWLRLLAFSFGAAVAGLTGTIAAPLHTGVFPTDFDLPLLITVYAMVILGGSGSLVGVAVGAIVINVALEVLTVPEHARWLFYGGILIALVKFVRPWRWLGIVLAGTVVFGLVVRQLAEWFWERGVAFGAPAGSDLVTRAVDSVVLLPSRPDEIAKYAYVALVASVLALTLVKGRTRYVCLIPTLYLAAFVWENLLVQEPSVTRLILLGALLVALMAARPEGLFGAKRVEIV